MRNSHPDPAWAATAAGEHASPNVTERGYEPSVASCVAVIWHQLVVQFRLIDGARSITYPVPQAWALIEVAKGWVAAGQPKRAECAGSTDYLTPRRENIGVDARRDRRPEGVASSLN